MGLQAILLGTLFYRFISENFIDYITGGDSGVDYAAMPVDDGADALGATVGCAARAAAWSGDQICTL